jgi:hypothetical protein
MDFNTVTSYSITMTHGTLFAHLLAVVVGVEGGQPAAPLLRARPATRGFSSDPLALPRPHVASTRGPLASPSDVLAQAVANSWRIVAARVLGLSFLRDEIRAI